MTGFEPSANNAWSRRQELLPLRKSTHWRRAALDDGHPKIRTPRQPQQTQC